MNDGRGNGPPGGPEEKAELGDGSRLEEEKSRTEKEQMPVDAAITAEDDHHEQQSDEQDAER